MMTTTNLENKIFLSNGIKYLNTEQFYFIVLYLLVSLMVLGGILLLQINNTIHGMAIFALIYLLFTDIVICLKMEFLGLIFIIIYIGAICILILFHVKLVKTFKVRDEEELGGKIRIAAYILILLMPLTLIIFMLESKDIAEETIKFNLNNYNIMETQFGMNDKIKFYSGYTNWLNLLFEKLSIKIFGYIIFNHYFMQLMIGALILFIAMIGSIFLTLVHYKKKKFQKLDSQIFTDIWESLKK